MAPESDKADEAYSQGAEPKAYVQHSLPDAQHHHITISFESVAPHQNRQRIEAGFYYRKLETKETYLHAGVHPELRDRPDDE